MEPNFLKNWRVVEYKGYEFLIWIEPEGDEIIIHCQTYVEGIGSVDSKMTCELLEEKPMNFIIDDLIGERFEQVIFEPQMDEIFNMVSKLLPTD
tara:strand:+ start:323 stop:604 length:282 start_codon:yes stop_codon:yes gene_type:complete